MSGDDLFYALDVLGVKYDLQITSPGPDQESDLSSNYNSRHSSIWINADMQNDRRLYTLVSNYMRAVRDLMGMRFTDQELAAISTGVYLLIERNFDLLTEMAGDALI